MAKKGLKQKKRKEEEREKVEKETAPATPERETDGKKEVSGNSTENNSVEDSAADVNLVGGGLATSGEQESNDLSNFAVHEENATQAKSVTIFVATEFAGSAVETAAVFDAAEAASDVGVPLSAEAEVAIVHSSITSPSQTTPHGLEMFSKVGESRGWSSKTIQKEWQKLGRKKRKTCGRWGALIGSFDDLFPENTSKRTRGTAAKFTNSVVDSDDKTEKSAKHPRLGRVAGDVAEGGNGEVEDTPFGDIANASPTGESANESGDDGDGSESGKLTQETDATEGSDDDPADDSQNDDKDSTDDVGVFTTGIHLFAQQLSKPITDPRKLLQSFVKEVPSSRLKFWNEARRCNLPELKKRKEITCEKGKRLRQISVVCRLELADRVEQFWKQSAASMAAELERASKDAKAAIYNKFKLKHFMSGAMADLWHLDVMERLSKTSCGIRRLLQDACFGERKFTSFPWGPSFVDGSYPLFDNLRVLNRAVIWPRFCISPSSSRKPRLQLIEPTKEGNERPSHAADTQREADGEDESSPMRLVIAETVKTESPPADGMSSNSAAVQHSKELVSSAQKSTCQKLRAKKRRKEKSKTYASPTKPNTFSAVSSASRQKIRREQRRRMEDGSIHSNFGSFCTFSRLLGVLNKRLANFHLSNYDTNVFEAVELEASFQEISKCYSLHEANTSTAVTSGARLFAEQADGSFHLRVVQIGTHVAPYDGGELRAALTSVAEFVDWSAAPRNLGCPQKHPTCAQLREIRNIRLGCWWTTAFGLCIHADTGLGGDLFPQLRRYCFAETFQPEEAEKCVNALKTLDEHLTSLVDSCFPHLAMQMRATANDCRLRNGQSVFSAVTFVGKRGRHSVKIFTDIGVRAFVNIPLEKKGKRKLMLPSFALNVEDKDQQFSVNLKHRSICFLPAKTAFGYSRDDASVLDKQPSCITLEFFCSKKLSHGEHGKSKKNAGVDGGAALAQNPTMRQNVVVLDPPSLNLSTDQTKESSKVNVGARCENCYTFAVQPSEAVDHSQQSHLIPEKKQANMEASTHIVNTVLS